jgi:hypothetical protein
MPETQRDLNCPERARCDSPGRSPGYPVRPNKLKLCKSAISVETFYFALSGLTATMSSVPRATHRHGDASPWAVTCCPFRAMIISEKHMIR